jgi:RND family efflux transporter MFP subunit
MESEEGMNDGPQERREPKMRRRTRLTLALVVLALVLAAGAVTLSGLATRESKARQLQARAQELSVPTVVVIAPGAGTNASPTLDLPGRIEAHSRALIHARVAGYLKSWAVDIGAPVKAGQLLAEIETPELDQQLLQARAELGSARANATLAGATARRWQSLQAQNFVSAQAVEEKNGELAVKQALVDASQANVDRLLAQKKFARIVAPFDGVVTARSTDIGALVSAGGAPGTELFVVADTRRLRVLVNVPQNQVSLVRRGEKVRFSVPERPGQEFSATVQALSQAIGSNSGSMLVQLTADNPDAGLLPGGFATVRFDLPKQTGRLTVPPGALIFGKSGLRVATVDADDKVLLKTVVVARDLGSIVELASGLAPGDRVIESPPDGVADGDVVRVKARGPGKESGKPPGT